MKITGKHTEWQNRELTVGGIRVEKAPLFYKPQIIDMEDGNRELTLREWEADATTIHLENNLLFIDPNASLAGGQLRLPAIADSAGLQLYIYNTSAEDRFIIIKTTVLDGDDDVTTCLYLGAAVVACDGFSWWGYSASPAATP